MIFLIVGARDAGKTKKIHDLHQELGGDGICLPKAFSTEGVFLGYDIMQLRSGKILPFARLAEHIPPDWSQRGKLGRYSFSTAGLSFATEVVDCLLQKHITPLFMDEIGPLELSGKGFHPLLRRMLAVDGELYLTVRPSLLSELIWFYSLASYRIITCG